MSKALNEIDIIKKLCKTHPWHSLVTIYTSFVRPHLDYGDVVYDQQNHESFTQKIERIQYNSTLTITGAIKGTTWSKLYCELGFGINFLNFNLKHWGWFRKLCTVSKIKITYLQEYLVDLIPQTNHSYNTRLPEDVSTFYSRTDFLNYSFFPSTILEWNYALLRKFFIKDWLTIS